ncbi:MAG: glutamate--tRNA ligase, partial [Pseudomonadota bacterium]|nr:glutamate--tRNA ligase [Pseudomonadota bacterium]
GPIFDVEKLSWLNGMWIREDLDMEALADRLQQWAFNRDNLMQVLPHAQQRMNTLSDFAPLTSFLASGQLALTRDSFTEVKLDEEQLKSVLQFALWRLEALRTWKRSEIFNTLKELSGQLDIKLKDFLAPLFVAIAGTTSSFSVMDSMTLLGPDMTRARIRHALQVCVGELGKKQLKKLEKAYAALS